MTASTPNVSAPASGAMLCVYPTKRKAFAMKTKTKLRFRSTIAHALIPAILGAALVSTGSAAQETRLQQAQKNADDILGLYDAEARKSELCKGYVGQVAKPVAFAALAAQLSGPAPKGEFETTAQYNARVAAASQPVPEGPVIITLPTDREFISYNADTGAMFVQAGAFSSADDAEQQRAKLAMAGVTAKVTEREQNGRVVHRVRVGPLDSREDAATVQEKLKAVGAEAALVRIEKPVKP